MTPRSRAAGIAMGAVLACLFAMPAARAETAYRYWSYWTASDGAWSFATMGPATSVPADGAVEGWRFVVTSEQGTADDAPTTPAASAFDDACGSTAPQDGRKRVAVIVDFGLPADAPAGERQPVGVAECVVADQGASGFELLSSVADVRTENGLVCGIDSYPLTECAAVVDASALAAERSVTERLLPTSTTGSPSGPLVSGLALLIVAGIGWTVWKRRRQ